MKTIKNNKKWIVVSSICLCLIIGGLVYYSGKKTVLTLGMFAGSNWDVPSGDCYKVIDAAIARFEDRHPNVEVKYESGILKEDYSSWLATRILQGDEPDVFMVLGADFNTLSSLGSLADLDTMINKDSDFDSDKYYQSSLLAGGYQGTQYALPYESNPTLMFVNRTLLEKESIEMPDNQWTIDDFYTICKQVTKDTDGNGVIDQYGCYNYNWQDSVSSHGATLFNEEGTESYFNQKSVNEALLFVQKLEGLNQGYAVTSNDFDEGRVAFSPMLFSQYRAYKPYPWRVKKYSYFEWDCVKMPSVEARESKTQLSSLLMSISSRTNHDTLAWEFLKELTYSVSSQEELFQYSQGISPLKEVTRSTEALSLLEEESLGDSKMDMTILNEVMENSTNSAKFKKYQGAIKIADYQIIQIIQQEDAIDTALMTLQREINRYLKE